MTDEHGSYAMMISNSWRQRLLERLFPTPPRPEIENDPRTFITTTIYTRVDWKDRVRTLLTGRIRIHVRTYTDVLVHEAESVSVFSVEPWR
jgi:hypothetical protein